MVPWKIDPPKNRVSFNSSIVYRPRVIIERLKDGNVHMCYRGRSRPLAVCLQPEPHPQWRKPCPQEVRLGLGFVVYGQLADKPTRRQTKSPKLIHWRFGWRRNVMETTKVALTYWIDRFSLERRGGINVQSFILNVSQLIGVKYETRSGRKRSMQNNSICLLYLSIK